MGNFNCRTKPQSTRDVALTTSDFNALERGLEKLKQSKEYELRVFDKLGKILTGTLKMGKNAQLKEKFPRNDVILEILTEMQKEGVSDVTIYEKEDDYYPGMLSIVLLLFFSVQG